MDIREATATAGYITFFISAASTVQMLAFNLIPLDYGSYVIFMTTLGSI